MIFQVLCKNCQKKLARCLHKNTISFSTNTHANVKKQQYVFGQCSLWSYWELSLKNNNNKNCRLYRTHVMEFLIGNNEIASQMFTERKEAQKWEGDRFIMRVGIWSWPEMAELAASWVKYAWAGWAQLSWRQGAYPWCYTRGGQGEEQKEKWDAEVFKVIFEAIFWAIVSRAKCLLRQKRKNCSNLILMNVIERVSWGNSRKAQVSLFEKSTFVWKEMLPGFKDYLSINSSPKPLKNGDCLVLMNKIK